MNALLNEHGFDSDKTILATSVCSDEVVHSDTFFYEYLPVKFPFRMGGLAGFPFSGLTGFGAFASHIPDNGFAIIHYGPHIGFSKYEQIGKVVRHGQAAESTCCGALQAFLNSLEDKTASTQDRELDYQQLKLVEKLTSRAGEINSHSEPLVAATDKMFDEIDGRIKQLLKESSDNFKGVKVALVGGIVINTDVKLPDWFELREFSVHSF